MQIFNVHLMMIFDQIEIRIVVVLFIELTLTPKFSRHYAFIFFLMSNIVIRPIRIVFFRNYNFEKKIRKRFDTENAGNEQK
jgi:hypothetical protein